MVTEDAPFQKRLKTPAYRFRMDGRNGKEKFKRMLGLFFCGQTKGFASLTAKRLACFETTKAAKFLKKFQVILYSMVKEITFLNEKFCIITVLNFAADFPFVNVSVTRIAFTD